MTNNIRFENMHLYSCSILDHSNFNWNPWFTSENSKSICIQSHRMRMQTENEAVNFICFFLLHLIDINQCIVVRQICERHQSIMRIDWYASSINLWNQVEHRLYVIAMLCRTVCRYSFHLTPIQCIIRVPIIARSRAYSNALKSFRSCGYAWSEYWENEKEKQKNYLLFFMRRTRRQLLTMICYYYCC